MNLIILIAINHLQTILKDRTNYILLLALPLALTFITGALFGGGGGSGEIRVVSVAVTDYDKSEISRFLEESLHIDSIAVEQLSEEAALEEVKSRDIAAAVIIPEGFGDSLKKGNPMDIRLIKADLSESPGLAEQQINALMYRLSAGAAAAAITEEEGRGEWLKTFSSAAEKWDPPPVKVNMKTITMAGDDQIPTGHRHSSPGFVVMFGMMTVITAGAGTLLQERENGTLSRLLTAPLTKFHLISGKMLGLMITGVLQMSIMILVGRLLFSVEWGRDLPALILLVVALSFASTGFGMMLSSLSRTKGQAEAVGVLSVLIMSMLGGSWWPVEILPAYMQAMAKVVPSGWAMQGFVDLIMRGAGLAQVALPVAVMFAFGSVFVTIGVVLFKHDK
ncbi:MAG: ABC transporter permease [Candidatus Contubernalis sp.]|nr:ABC transporter permease [Candidatus Contubernalis sp.]